MLDVYAIHLCAVGGYAVMVVASVGYLLVSEWLERRGKK